MERKNHIEYKLLIELFVRLKNDTVCQGDSFILKDEEPTWALFEDMKRRGINPEYNIWTHDRIQLFYNSFSEYMIEVFKEIDKSHESSI